MRQLPVIIIILASGILACNPSAVKGRNGVIYKSAVQYNDYIVSRQAKLMQNILDFSKAAEQDLDLATKMLDKYTIEAARTIEELKGMPAYKRDSSLRDAAVRSFGFYKNVFQYDYFRILTIRKKGADITNEDIDEMQKIVEKITREEEGFDKAFQNAQKNFADRNHMKLIENDMQKKFDKEFGE